MSKSIMKACVRYNDRLYTGFDHGECFKKLNKDNMIIVYSYIEQGFVDSDGNFVDRKQAMIIAKEAGQLRYEPSKKTLISEDLHLDWLNKQDQRIAELEEQLKNSIRPKFKPHNDLFVIVGYKDESKIIEQYYIDEIVIRGNGKYIEYRDIEKETIIGENNLLFATKEEALAKMEELKGENK